MGLFGSPKRGVPYDMFDRAKFGLAAKNARILERIYHKGQARSWDGKEVLRTLIQEEGKPELPAETRAALGRVFALIMWGELAAWRISAELADELDPFEAKMAATSQAHDEARHFYTMHDYLETLGAVPDRLDFFAQKMLEEVMNADHLAKKLMGMQLMVEPVALTLFHVVKKLDLEPVLTRLLPYYERDEARHVALGVQYLPALMSRMSTTEKLDLWMFQLRLVTYECMSMRGLAGDMLKLGVPPRELIRVGMGKQLSALEQLFEGHDFAKDVPIAILNRYAGALIEMTLPYLEGNPSLQDRLNNALRALQGKDVMKPVDLVPDVREEDVPLIRRVS